MSAFAAFLAILSALTVGAISPGPTFVLVSRIAVSASRPAALACALGTGLGGLLFAVLALAGLTALLHEVPVLDRAVRLAGGAYLIYLGVMIWRGASKPLTSDGGTAAAQSPLRAFLLGVLTQASNPKTAIVYGSVFASLLPKEVPGWMLIALPLAIGAMEMIWYGTVALMLSSRRPKAAYLAAKAWIDRVAGSVMGLLGARLVYDALNARRALV